MQIRVMLLFFNMGGGEIFLILLVVYLVFGPKKIPEIARQLGKGINELRRATDDIKREINREVNKVKNEVDPGLDINDIKKNVQVDIDLDIDKELKRKRKRGGKAKGGEDDKGNQESTPEKEPAKGTVPRGKMNIQEDNKGEKKVNKEEKQDSTE